MLDFARKHQWLLALAIITFFALFIHAALFPLIADTDAFYHLAHATIYRTGGIFQSGFPWAQFSDVNKYSADLWYGFHLLLIPFTFFSDPLVGIYWGAFFVTVASLLLAYGAFRLLKLKWPIFWTLAFALLTADFLYRLTMLRPHPLSLGLLLLLFALLQRGGERWKDFFLIATVAAAFAWIHIALTWVPVLVTAAVLLTDALEKRGLGWRSALAVAGGLLAGWLLRPNPLGAAKLAYVQVVKLLLIKQQDLPLRFGHELAPFYWENFVDQLIPIALLLVLATGFLVWLIRQKKTRELDPAAKSVVWSSFLLTGVFAVLTFAVARRSNEIFAGFAVIFLAEIFALYPKFQLPGRRGWNHYAVVIAVLFAFIYAPIKNFYRFETYLTHAVNPVGFKTVGGWLKTNAQPGEIVFNPHWDRFGQLLFWDPKNYYINGMDPVFEYDYDPALYWETHFYAIDAASGFTCRQIRCKADETVDTYTALKKDFLASYALVEKLRSPNFYHYLDRAPKFKKVFETETEALYKLI